MRFRSVRLAAVLLVAALVACSHSGSAPLLPNPGTGPALGDAAVATGISIRIQIPSNGTTVGVHGVHSNYVSKSTKSIVIVFTPGHGRAVTVNKNLTAATNIACKGKPLVCTFAVALNAGTYNASFTTYDGLLKTGNPTGNQLSANQSVPLKIVSGQVPQLKLTLGGIPKNFIVMPANDVTMTGSVSKGLQIIGNMPQKFTLLAADADGNAIIGPGAPQVIVTSAPANTTLATPAPNAPTLWTITSTYTTATSPTTAMNVELPLHATPAHSTGANGIQANIPLALYQPWIYVVNRKANTLSAFDEAGNAKTLSGTAFSALNTPYFAAYSPRTHWLYVSQCAGPGDGSITPMDVNGDTVTPAASPGPFPNVACGGQDLIAPNDGLLYAANWTFYAGTTAVNVYDTQGHQKSLAGTPFVDGGDAGWGLTLDTHNDLLYLTDYTGSKIYAFNQQGVAQITSGAFPNLSHPNGLTFDPDNNLIYVTNLEYSNPIAVYDESGHQKTTSGNWAGLTSPCDLAYDPYNGYLYVSDSAADTVGKYDGHGNVQSISGTFPGLNSPCGITIVP